MADDNTASVQAELQEYLNSKDINGLFIHIVEQLLIHKPDNPIGFMVEYLLKKYPEKARALSLGLVVSDKAEPPPGPGNRKSTSTSQQQRHSTNILSDEDSDDDSENDVVDDIPQTKLQSTANLGAGRRVSVSAETVDPNAAQVEFQKIPKTEQQSARIREILAMNIMFKHLDEQQVQKVKDAMFQVDKKKGDVIIKEGEQGDNFYVIDEGTIDVFINKEGVETKIKSMGSGEAFGELALMYSTPRTATCKATTDLRLWALDRLCFKLILMQTTINRRNQYRDFIGKVPILQSLTEYELLTVADALVEEKLSEGHVVCMQGDTGDTFYIIKEGFVTCSQLDTTGQQREVARLTVGDYFGEIALMTSKPRQATVRCVGGTTSLLSLDRKTFKRVLGRMEDILKRNMDAYKKIQASAI